MSAVWIEQSFERVRTFQRDNSKAKSIKAKIMEFIALDIQLSWVMLSFPDWSSTGTRSNKMGYQSTWWHPQHNCDEFMQILTLLLISLDCDCEITFPVRLFGVMTFILHCTALPSVLGSMKRGITLLNTQYIFSQCYQIPKHSRSIFPLEKCSIPTGWQM